MPKRNTTPAKVSRGPLDAEGRKTYVVTCIMTKCKSFKIVKSSANGASMVRAAHNREKHSGSKVEAHRA